MARYEIVKHLKATYQVDAESVEAALQVPWPKDDPDAVSIIRERARDTERKPSAGTIPATDRVMRAGRVFERTYKGHSFIATALPGARIRLEGDGIAEPQTVKNLHQAAQIAVELADGRPHATNAWAFWHEAEPLKHEKKAAAQEEEEAQS